MFVWENSRSRSCRAELLTHFMEDGARQRTHRLLREAGAAVLPGVMNGPWDIRTAILEGTTSARVCSSRSSGVAPSPAPRSRRDARCGTPGAAAGDAAGRGQCGRRGSLSRPGGRRAGGSGPGPRARATLSGAQGARAERGVAGAVGRPPPLLVSWRISSGKDRDPIRARGSGSRHPGSPAPTLPSGARLGTKAGPCRGGASAGAGWREGFCWGPLEPVPS